MSRKILAIVEIDEDVAQELSEDYAPGEYFEKEFGWLQDSGISLRDWLVSDEDDVEKWARYIDYLIEWAFEHSSDYHNGMSPACYDEWCDNEDCDNEETHNDKYIYIVTHRWCIEDEPTESKVLGAFEDYNSARDCFLKEKIKETQYAIKNGWVVYTDNETTYDIGKDGYYNENHSELSITRMKIGGEVDD